MADDPTARDFGRLEQQVDALDSKFGHLASQLTHLSEQVTKLTHLAEQGKGAYWMAALIFASVGAAASMLIGAFANKP